MSSRIQTGNIANFLAQTALAFPTWAWAVSSLGILIAYGLTPFGIRRSSLPAKK